MSLKTVEIGLMRLLNTPSHNEQNDTHTRVDQIIQLIEVSF